MEDQSEQENSPQTYEPDSGGSGHETSSMLERLRESLERRELTIENLRQTVAIMKRNIAEQREEIIRLKNLNNSYRKMQNPQISLPFELIKMIFYLCDARTRCRICCIDKRSAEELSSWVDVQHLYLTRVPIEDGVDKTIVTHAYQAITNSPTVGVIRTAKAIPMLHNFRNVKTILVESSTMRFLDRCNKIPQEEGFFSLLRKLETVKLCSIRDNLSLLYTLSDFLTLPNLRTLHVRETLALVDVPPVDQICAPIEDLRICTHRIRLRHLLTICRALSTTLRRLELLLTVIVPEGAATMENRNAAVMEVAEAMTSMENLNYLTLARTFLKPAISERIFALLKLFRSLSTITFEALNLTDFIQLVNAHLPFSAKRIIVTESVKIGPSWYPLNSGSMEFFDVFNDERMPQLQDACRKVKREITLQFGRLRGFRPATVNLQLGVVRILANRTSPLQSGVRKGDCRVFLWKGHILTRSEYLKMNVPTNKKGKEKMCKTLAQRRGKNIRPLYFNFPPHPRLRVVSPGLGPPPRPHAISLAGEIPPEFSYLSPTMDYEGYSSPRPIDFGLPSPFAGEFKIVTPKPRRLPFRGRSISAPPGRSRSRPRRRAYSFRGYPLPSFPSRPGSRSPPPSPLLLQEQEEDENLVPELDRTRMSWEEAALYGKQEGFGLADDEGNHPVVVPHESDQESDESLREQYVAPEELWDPFRRRIRGTPIVRRRPRVPELHKDEPNSPPSPGPPDSPAPRFLFPAPVRSRTPSTEGSPSHFSPAVRRRSPTPPRLELQPSPSLRVNSPYPPSSSHYRTPPPQQRRPGSPASSSVFDFVVPPRSPSRGVCPLGRSPLEPRGNPHMPMFNGVPGAPRRAVLRHARRRRSPSPELDDTCTTFDEAMDYARRHNLDRPPNDEQEQQNFDLPFPRPILPNYDDADDE